MIILFDCNEKANHQVYAVGTKDGRLKAREKPKS
jgi:hypothetical protein